MYNRWLRYGVLSIICEEVRSRVHDVTFRPEAFFAKNDKRRTKQKNDVKGRNNLGCIDQYMCRGLRRFNIKHHISMYKDSNLNWRPRYLYNGTSCKSKATSLCWNAMTGGIRRYDIHNTSLKWYGNVSNQFIFSPIADVYLKPSSTNHLDSE